MKQWLKYLVKRLRKPTESQLALERNTSDEVEWQMAKVIMNEGAEEIVGTRRKENRICCV